MSRLVRHPIPPVVCLPPGTLGVDREALFRSLTVPPKERTAVPAMTVHEVRLPRNSRHRAAKWVE